MLGDDFVETDGGVHNVRVFNNRGVNAAHGGYSAQPVFGGPVYFIRNILYHVPSGVAFKFSAKPAGLFVYHNTIIGEQIARDPSANVHFRNNLFLGRDTPERGIMAWANATPAYSSDYNGYRPNAGVDRAVRLARARSQAQTRLRAEGGALAELPDAGRVPRGDRQEAHGIEVDFDVFERLTPPDPGERHAVYHAMDLDFRLKPARQRRGRRRGDPDRQRRLRRARARPRRARSGAAAAALRAALAGLAAVLSLTR